MTEDLAARYLAWLEEERHQHAITKQKLEDASRTLRYLAETLTDGPNSDLGTKMRWPALARELHISAHLAPEGGP